MILASLDTNVLLYAADSIGDADKHQAAVDLLDRLSATGRAMLPLQALTEFYAVACRKRRVPVERAAAFVDAWADVFPVREAVFADVADAMRVHREHDIAFWDGMIWAVSRRAGARLLLSEDLQDGRELEGVRIMNPFKPACMAEIVDVLSL